MIFKANILDTLGRLFWFPGLIPYAMLAIYPESMIILKPDDYFQYKQRQIASGVVVFGMICHGSNLFNFRYAEFFRKIDILYVVYVTININYIGIQPNTFIHTVISMIIWFINQKIQSPLVHMFGVQLVLFRGLFYSI